MNEFLIVFRETLEFSIIIGLILILFNKFNDKKGVFYTVLGAALGLLGSILCAYFLIVINRMMDHHFVEKLFEGLMMYLAGGLIFYLVVWLGSITKYQEEIKEKTHKAHTLRRYSIVFLMAFFAVLREGFETAIFLISSFNIAEKFSYLGFFLGFFLAILVGYLIFVKGKKLSLKPLFTVTTLLLIIFASGMITYGTHEIEEFFVKSDQLKFFGIKDKVDENQQVIIKAADQIKRPWDILKPKKTLSEKDWVFFYQYKDGKYYHYFHDKGLIGMYLKIFFGYNSNPNWIEFFLWIFSLSLGLFIWYRAKIFLNTSKNKLIS